MDWKESVNKNLGYAYTLLFSVVLWCISSKLIFFWQIFAVARAARKTVLPPKNDY